MTKPRFHGRILISSAALALLAVPFTSYGGGAKAKKESSPAARHEFASSLLKCKPSCYQPEKAAEWKPYQGCGYKVINFQRPQLITGAYGKIDGIAEGDIVESSCSFPHSGGKWSSVLAEARGTYAVPAGGSVYIAGDATWTDWSRSSSDTGTQSVKSLEARLYGKDWKFEKNPCDPKSSKVFCEKGGSRVVMAINAARYRVEEAKQKQTAGDKESCRLAAWDAMALPIAVDAHKDFSLRYAKWTEGGTYVTKAGEKLSEDAAFALLKKIGADGAALYEACEGDPKAAPVKDDTAYTGWNVMSYKTAKAIEKLGELQDAVK